MSNIATNSTFSWMESSLIVWIHSFIIYSGCVCVFVCMSQTFAALTPQRREIRQFWFWYHLNRFGRQLFFPLDGIAQWVLPPQKNTQSKKKITFFQKQLLHLVRSVRCLCGFGPLPWWSFTLGGNGISQWVLPSEMRFLGFWESFLCYLSHVFRSVWSLSGERDLPRCFITWDGNENSPMSSPS